MKNFRDYLSESKEAADNPVVGDTFAINIREECLIESVVVESRRDGVVIAADERMMQLLESYGYSFEQTCMECGGSGCGCGQSADEYGDETDVGQDPGEYDQEGDMAKDELMTMIRSARKLIGMLDTDDNMPEWTQKKITKATDYADTAADYISSQKERGVMEQSQEDSPVARATLHRIMMQHTGMLAQHGPERVMQAVDDVADLVGDVDEIGTSDVSGWVNMVQEILDSLDQGVAEGHADQQRKIFKKNGQPVGEVGIDRESSPGVGQYYMKHYASGKDLSGFDSFEEAVQELRHLTKQGVAEGAEQLHPETLELIDEYIAKIEPDADRDEMIQSVIRGSIHPSELEYALKEDVAEAEYQGRKVQLGKKMKGDVKKSKVYVKNPQGNVVKVNFGDPNMKIRKSNPGARKSFRARHNCDNPGPRHKARYWSCRSW